MKATQGPTIRRAMTIEDAFMQNTTVKDTTGGFFIVIKKMLFAAMFFSFILVIFNDQAAAEQNFVCVEVVGQNVNLRDAPSMKGKVIGQATEREYIAVSPPIQEKSDSWYQLFFTISDYGNYHHNRLDKEEAYNFSTPYINARFVKVVPLTQADQQQIEWFRKGRPIRHNTGDRLDGPAFLTKITAIKEPLSLSLEPKEGAKKQTFPIGTRIFVYKGPTSGGFSYEDNGILFYNHVDMNDVLWLPILGEDRRIIGWIQYDGEPPIIYSLGELID